jgi:hypothetical protein
MIAFRPRLRDELVDPAEGGPGPVEHRATGATGVAPSALPDETRRRGPVCRTARSFGPLHFIRAVCNGAQNCLHSFPRETGLEWAR